MPNQKKKQTLAIDTATVVAYSLMVYKKQGFIRSGQGHIQYDESGNRGRELKDNKTVVLDMISKKATVPDDIVEETTSLVDSFNGKLMIKKMTHGLNNFETSLVSALESPFPTKFNVSILASLPHMSIIDKRRQSVSDEMERLRYKSEFFGEKGTRYDITVEVIDVKYIQSSGIYMITSIYNDKDIIKFWWRDQPDLTDIIDGKICQIRGTVKSHEVGKFTSANETMLNRVKILSC